MVKLFLRYDAFIQTLPQEVDDLAVISRCSHQHVDLILPLYNYLKGSDELERFSVDLEGNDLVLALRYQRDLPALAHLEGHLHTHLNLTHMQHISQANHLNHPITKRLPVEGLFRISLPEISNSSSPILNIQKDKILIFLNIDLSVIDSHREMFSKQRLILILKQV